MGKKLKGIEGWLLVLFAIMIIGLFGNILTTINAVTILFDSDKTSTFIFTLIHAAIFISLSGYALFLGFGHRKNFRKWATASIMYNMFFAFLSVVGIKFMPELVSKDIVQSIMSKFYRTMIWGAIFIGYLYKSKRVKNTFVK